jgi:ATP-dependent helicase/nuclease subunit A
LDERPDAVVRAEYAFFAREHFERLPVLFDETTWKLALARLADVVDGIEARLYPATPEPPGWRQWVPCRYCEPDELGTTERYPEWERKRHDPCLVRWFGHAAARARIGEELDATLFVDAGAGAGKTTALVGRVVALVDAGVPIESIAAITFTEKAAAELRHRLRERLADGASPARDAAREGLDHAPIGTLHAFARRLLFEFPVEAGLPPGFDVLDELESQLALDERWEDLQDELLDDATREVAPDLAATELLQLFAWGKFGGLAGLRSMVEDFQANWDLVEERVDLEPSPRPQPDLTAVLAAADAVVATPVPAGDKQEALVEAIARGVEELRRAGSGLGTIPALEDLKERTAKPFRTGNKGNWKATGGAAALDELRQREHALSLLAEAALAPCREYRRLVTGAIAGRFVLDGAQARARMGTLEFHDLLVLARRVLTRSPPARRILHDRYRRVLLDEFQDTDPIQLSLAILLTSAPDTPAASARPEPGRLFVVGDPKQSIYRFRRADIAVYLGAAGRIGADEVALSANFRSTTAVIEWVNGVFSEVIQAEPEVQPAYRPLDVARVGATAHGTVTVLGADAHEEPLSADELRWCEARDIAAAVATALRDGWAVDDGHGGVRPCRPGDVAILLPARTSLPMLERSLAELDVPYRAENASVVYLAPEIRHVMLALQAAADPTDELALVAALRSPLYGCSDVDLYDWKVAGGRWNLFAPPPGPRAGGTVADGIAHLRTIAERSGRLGPADLVDAVVVERRVLEAALCGPDARDVWRRVRYVVDQARAWTDAGGRGLRRYLRWTRFQASEGRASDTILPERDHDAVRVMTVHAAKGLEFPITVVGGLTTLNRGRRSMSVVWPPGTWTLAERDNPLFESFQPLDEQMGDAERRRLLYVACTRAVDHLVVSLHRKPERESDDHGTRKWSSASVLAAAGAFGHGAVPFAGSATPLPRAVEAALELPWADHAEWSRERARAVRSASARSTTSATRLAGSMPVAPGQPASAPDRADSVGVAVHAPPAGADPLGVPVNGPADGVDPLGVAVADGADGAEPLGPAVAMADDSDLLGLAVDAGLAKEPVDLDLPPWQRGRYGTAIGRAVHAVLQDADLADGHDVEHLAAAHAAAEGIFGLESTVAGLSRSALAAPIVGAVAAGAEHWRELFVVAELGDKVLEGYIDLLVRTPEGLVIVDYKTDQFGDDVSRVERLARYRFQLAAYGLALGQVLDEPVVGGLLVHCRVDGPAEQLTVPDWSGALAAVRAAVPVLH